MSSPFWWNKTITIQRRHEDKSSGKTIITWTEEIIDGCFFGLTSRRYFDGQSVINQNNYVVRIPSEKCDPISKGDIIVCGSEQFTVNVARDNSALPGGHYYGTEG